MRVYVSEFLPLLRSIEYPPIDDVPALANLSSAFGEETICPPRAGGLCVHSDVRFVEAIGRVYPDRRDDSLFDQYATERRMLARFLHAPGRCRARSRSSLASSSASCASACAKQRGCLQYIYYEPTVFCVMLATADVQWFYRLSGAWQYERRMVDPTEPFGSGECRCNQYRMNRYYLPNVHSQQACVRYCTVALGCVGVEAAAPQRTWNTPVEGIPELWKTGDLYGCAIVTTHKKQEWWPDLPTNAQVLYEVGEDPKCVSIGGVWTGSERAKNVRCRRAQQSAPGGMGSNGASSAPARFELRPSRSSAATPR